MLLRNKQIVEELQKEYASNKATDKERREAMIATRDNPKNAADFAAARAHKVYLNWLADSTALDLFEYIPLKDNERPIVISETDQSYNVLEINQHGTPAADSFINLDTVNEYLMYQLSTDRVDAPTLSIQTGQLDVSDRVNRRLAYFVERAVNKDVWTLIDAAFGSYPAGTFVLDEDIAADTIPTTNDIDGTAVGSLGLDVFKLAAEQAALTGRKITKVIINPTERSDLFDWESLVEVSGTAAADLITEEMRQKILRDADIGRLFGNDFIIQLDNTRPKKYAWFFTNEPAGLLYDKPGMERTVYYTEKELMILAKKKYHEGYHTEKVIKPLLPAPNRLNFFRIQFVS